MPQSSVAVATWRNSLSRVVVTLRVYFWRWRWRLYTQQCAYSFSRMWRGSMARFLLCLQQRQRLASINSGARNNNARRKRVSAL